MPDVIEVVRDYVLPVVIVVVVAFVLVRASRLFIHGIVKALMDREATEGTAQELSAVELQKRMDTLDGLGANVIQFFIVIIAGLMVLRSFGLDIGPAVAGLGVVGVAVGFGAQNLVRDYLNGALILIENQFSKGDVIRAAGVSGTVEDFSLRRTTLRDLDGVVHTVPNGEIVVASNLTRVWSRTRSGAGWPVTRSGSGASSRRRGSIEWPRSGSTE
jgi:small-conductance mechanosensitive channel